MFATFHVLCSNLIHKSFNNLAGSSGSNRLISINQHNNNNNNRKTKMTTNKMWSDKRNLMHNYSLWKPNEKKYKRNERKILKTKPKKYIFIARHTKHKQRKKSLLGNRWILAKTFRMRKLFQSPDWKQFMSGRKQPNIGFPYYHYFSTLFEIVRFVNLMYARNAIEHWNNRAACCYQRSNSHMLEIEWANSTIRRQPSNVSQNGKSRIRKHEEKKTSDDLWSIFFSLDKIF